MYVFKDPSYVFYEANMSNFLYTVFDKSVRPVQNIPTFAVLYLMYI